MPALASSNPQSTILNPQSIEPKPPPRAPTLTALKGPLPDDPVKLWELVIGACATQHRMRMLVGNMKLLKVDNDLALLQVPEELHPTAATAQQDLSNLLSTAWGQQVRVEIESLPPSPQGGGRPGSAAAERGRGGETPTTTAAQSPTRAPEAAPLADTTPRPPITDHPLIKQAIDLFGAKVIGVQARRKQAE
jgi:hypothetical protein